MDDRSRLTWQDMEKLGATWNDLKNVTWNDLSLPLPELMDRMREKDAPMPISLVEKLQTMCNEISHEDEDAHFSISKKSLTIGEAVGIISIILSFLDKLPDLGKKYQPIIEEIIEFFRSNL